MTRDLNGIVIWTRANKFIKDIEKLGNVIPKDDAKHEKDEVKG